MKTEPLDFAGVHAETMWLVWVVVMGSGPIAVYVNEQEARAHAARSGRGVYVEEFALIGCGGLKELVEVNA